MLFLQHILRGGTKADRVESCDGLQVSRSVVCCVKGGLITVLTITTIGARSVIRRLAVGQRDDMLCGDDGDSGIIKKILCIDKAPLQIGAAVGTQAVEGVQNSDITIGSGNVLPARCYGCACTETDQRNIAAVAAGFIAIKEIDGRSLGILQAGGATRVVNMPSLATLTHRTGRIDDEHRCGLRVAGLGRGGLFQHNLQRDIIGVVADGYSGLADGINAHGQRRRVGVWA